MGVITADVILAELGDWRRFGSQAEVASYAGLVPGFRESAGKAKQLGITKEGSSLLRWVMIEFAWRMVGASRKWGGTTIAWKPGSAQKRRSWRSLAAY